MTIDLTVNILKTFVQISVVCMMVANGPVIQAATNIDDKTALVTMSDQLSEWGCQAPALGNFYEVRQCRIKVSNGVIAALIRPGEVGGQILVLVHGGPGLGNEYMEPLDTIAAPKWTVVDYEQRGVRPKVQPTTYAGLRQLVLRGSICGAHLIFRSLTLQANFAG